MGGEENKSFLSVKEFSHNLNLKVCGKYYIQTISITNEVWFIYSMQLTLLAPTPQNGQTHSNNSSVTAEELFECL